MGRRHLADTTLHPPRSIHAQTSWAPRGVNPLDPADSLLLPDRPQQLVQGAQQQQQGL